MPVFERRIGNSLSYTSSEIIVPTDADDAVHAKTFYSIVGCLGQLSELVKKSSEVFAELTILTSTVNIRLDSLSVRTAKLFNDSENVQMPINTTLVISGDNHQSQNYRQFLQSASTQHIVKTTIPNCILSAYESDTMRKTPDFYSLDAYKSSLMNGARIVTVTHRYSNPDFFLNQWCAAQETRLRKLEVEKERQKNDKKMRKLQSETAPGQGERRHSKKKESISWQDRYMVDGQPVHRSSHSTPATRPSLPGKSEDSPIERDAAQNKKPFAELEETALSAAAGESQASNIDSPPPTPPPPVTAAAAGSVSGHKRRVSFETPIELPPDVVLKLQQKQDALIAEVVDRPLSTTVSAAAVTGSPITSIEVQNARDSVRSEAVSSASTPDLHGAVGSRGPVFSTHSDASSGRCPTDPRESDSDDDSDFDDNVDYRLDPQYRVQPESVDLRDSARVFVSPSPLVVGRGYSTRSYGTVKSNATLHYSSAYPHDDALSSRTAPGAQGDSPVPPPPTTSSDKTDPAPSGEARSSPPPPPAMTKPAVVVPKDLAPDVVVEVASAAVRPSPSVAVPSPPSRLSVSPVPPPPPVGISPKAAGAPSPPPPPGPSPTKRDSGAFSAPSLARKDSTGSEAGEQTAKTARSIAGTLFGFASGGGDSFKNPSPPPPPPGVSPMATPSKPPVHYLEDDSNNGMITLTMPPMPMPAKSNPPRPPPPVVAAPNKRTSQRLLVKSIRLSHHTQPAQFHIESELVDAESPPRPAPHPLTAGILGGAKLTAVAEGSSSPGHDAANRDGSDTIARRESAPPAIGNIFAAIRRGSTLKKVDVKEEEEKKKDHNRAKSMGGFGDSSVAAILERRKFLEAESSGSESDNDWD